MTKRIRVENADCNRNYRVLVHQQQRGTDGWATVQSDEITTTQVYEVYIYDGKRLIIEEKSTGPAPDEAKNVQP